MTVRARDLVRRADAVICDQLVWASLTDKGGIGRDDLIRRPRWQDDLNQIIEAELKKGKSVVRLKTGDPAIFGRTVLEAGYFLDRGYQVKIVPGVTSALASPLYAGILTTMNDVSNRVVILTGTLAKEGNAKNIPAYDPQTTLVLLMAVRKIDVIASAMMNNFGYPSNYPVCVVQDASSKVNRKSPIFSNLSKIANVVNDPLDPVRTPATFIFGWACAEKNRVANLNVWTGIETSAPRSIIVDDTKMETKGGVSSSSSSSSEDEEEENDDLPPSTLPKELFLVGAGPGDPKLMTLRAQRLLLHADVVICDRLIYDSMRDFLGRTDIIRRPKKQAEVNSMIETELKRGKSVVRLKTGDPAIFGRTALEAGHFTRQGRRVHIVPGISSALAAPLCAGVLTTMRGVANRIVIMTANLAKGRDATNVPPYEPNTTLVLLMGVRKIRGFCERLIRDHGYPSDLGACVVQEASTTKQRVVFSCVSKIADASSDIRSPAVFAFGRVCGASRTKVEGLRVWKGR